MQSVKTYLLALFVAFAVLSYIFFPFAYQEAGSSLISCLASLAILTAAFINGKLPHPLRFTTFQWLSVAFVIVQFGLVFLSSGVRHSLVGFSFDTTSGALLILVFLLTLVSDGLPQKTRRALFVVSAVGLIVLVLYPLVRSQIHVRPSSEVTFAIESAVHADLGTRALLFGTGPNSFVYVWQKYRPQAVLSTPFWSDDFPVGSSVVFTVLIESGVVSALLLVLVYITAFVEGCFRKAFLSSLFLVGALWALMFGEPSAPLVLVSGVLLATFRQTERAVFSLSTFLRKLALVICCTLFLCVLYIGLSVALYFYSFSKVASGDLVRAQSAGQRSYILTREPQTARLLTQILRSTGHELSRINSSKEKIQIPFKQASKYARESTLSEPLNAQNWKLLGIALAEELALERSRELLDEGENAFDQAQKLSPLDVSVPFFKAQMYILAGDRIKAAEALDTALLLRPSYVEARNLREAIK